MVIIGAVDLVPWAVRKVLEECTSGEPCFPDLMKISSISTSQVEIGHYVRLL
jgi:hypothetical protein